MKKTIKALACMILCACVSISTPVSAAPYPSTENVQDEEIQANIALQKDAVEAHALFEDNLPTTEEGCFIYPKSFGGEYIDDVGNLVIQVTSDDCAEYEYLQEAYSCVEFEQVKYSKEYLDSLISDFLTTYDRNTEQFYMAYIDVENNCAVVEVDEATLATRTDTYSNLPLVFKLGSPTNTCSTTVYGGDTICNRKSLFNWYYMTAGIGAVNYSSGECVITAGHNMAVNDKIYLGSKRIGTVTYSSYTNNGLGDFSVVTLINDNTTSDIVREGTDGVAFHNAGTHNAVVNQTITDYSENNGAGGTFKVSLTDVTTNLDGVTIRGQSVANIISGTVKFGDSGSGLFYRNPSNSRKYFCGILSGFNEEGKYIAFTPVSSMRTKVKSIMSY